MISVPSAFPDGLSSIKTEPVTPWRNDPKLLATGALVSYDSMAWLVRQGNTGTPSLTYNHQPDEFSLGTPCPYMDWLFWKFQYEVVS